MGQKSVDIIIRKKKKNTSRRVKVSCLLVAQETFSTCHTIYSAIQIQSYHNYLNKSEQARIQL